MRILLRRRGLVLLAALLLMILAGVAGRDAGDKARTVGTGFQGRGR